MRDDGKPFPRRALIADSTRDLNAGPVWRPANPGDQPSQKLINAKLAYDRQQMERVLDHLQIHDPISADSCARR
jgi:hypothetical protein